MAFPFTGACAMGQGVNEGTSDFVCCRFFKPIVQGSSILVLITTSGGSGGTPHAAPTDTAGNTYVAIGQSTGLLSGRVSAWLASNVTGEDGLIVTGHAGNAPTWYGIVAWPLYGAHTSNGDFVASAGSISGAIQTPIAASAPTGSWGFAGVSTNGASHSITPSDDWFTIYQSNQANNAIGQSLFTNILDLTAGGTFQGEWTSVSGSDYAAFAFSLQGPTVPALAPIAGLTQSLFSRTNTTNATDDGSNMEAFSGLYGFAGWMSDSIVAAAEALGSHCWPTESQVTSLDVAVDVTDAGGDDVTRTYAVRVNGIDTAMSVTLSGASSATPTRLTGTVTGVLRLQVGDVVSLHRTGSGADPEFDVTWWNLLVEHEGPRTSVSAMVHCGTNNGEAAYGAPLTWKGQLVSGAFGQFTTDTLNRSLVAFDGTIRRYVINFVPNAALKDGTYTFVWMKNDVAQDGTGGTPDTTIALTGDELMAPLVVAVPFEIGDYLQLRQVPSGTAFNTAFNVGVEIESTEDGAYGLSVDWAGFFGGHLGATKTYSGVNRAAGITASTKEAILIGSVTFGRMNILQSAGGGPGDGKHLFYRLQKNDTTELEIDLTGNEVYAVVEGSVPYVLGDTQVWEYEGSGLPTDQAFVMGIAMAGPYSENPTPEPPAPPSTNTYLIRRLRRSIHLSSENFNQFFNRLEIEFQPGVGIPFGQGEDPMCMLRYSDDGGFTWSNEIWVNIGRQGEYKDRAIWNRLGKGRDRVFEVSMSDPVFWAIMRANIFVTKGTH